MSNAKFLMSNDIRNLKVALVHEELTQLGGAERVLDVLLEIFPKAPIYTLVYDKEKTKNKYEKFDVRPSFIQRIPFGVKKYKWFLAFMPWATESFDLGEYDLVISDASALIKGVKTRKDQTHICYCHTPTRYLWVDSKSYIKNAPIPFFVRPFMPLVLNYLKKWDLKASKRPDFYIANAENIKEKIKKYYNRDSAVIYPPVESDKFQIKKEIGDYFLLVSRIEPYKKVDMVIDAFNQMPDKKLKIVGSGSKIKEMRVLAKENIEFTGRVSDEELANAFEKAISFIFPQEEDFGIVAVEAMSAGRPVVAYKKGGALESIIEGKTGEFFYPQTSEALIKTIKNFNSQKYNSQEIRAHAKKFDKAVFKQQILEYIINKLKVKS